MKTYTKGKAVKLSANFKSTEFDCKGKGCCSKTLIDENLIIILQKIRDHFGQAVNVNSGYRCSVHNKAVGGATSSLHAKGQAADINIKGVAPKEVAKYAESIGVKGIGLYETKKDGYFVHIDTREKKAFWYGQSQIKRTTFGGNKVIEFQNAAITDGYGYLMPSGADGIWGKECEAVAKKAVCKRWQPKKNVNLTKFIQKIVGVEADGKFGAGTQKAVKTYQLSVGLKGDGIVGSKTYKKMVGVN